MLFAERIKTTREDLNIPQKVIAEAIGIDVPMYSRIERGERPAKREQVIGIAKQLGIDEKELINLWLAEKVLNIVSEEEDANIVLNIVSNNIE
jgi:transcriptional regulator with XRE-family HTH domain